MGGWVKSDFIVSVCVHFELLDTQTQNGHLVDTQTHGHKMDTKLDKNNFIKIKEITSLKP